MKKILFIGENGSGKEALIQSLSTEPLALKKTMSVEFYGNFINVPNEFLENKCFFNSLITASFDAEIIIITLSAKQKSTLLPPLFAPLFNKKVLGIITYTEFSNEITDEHFIRAKKFLQNAGVKDIFLMNLENNEGLEEIKSEINL